MTYEQILSIAIGTNNEPEFTNLLMENTKDTAEEAASEWFESTTFDEEDTRTFALMEHLDELYEDCDTNRYLVLTDEEADEAWEESIDSYIDECILPELPEVAQNYFDRDRFARDCKYDGRGHSLSSFDGEEHEVAVLGTDYYIYRIN